MHEIQARWQRDLAALGGDACARTLAEVITCTIVIRADSATPLREACTGLPLEFVTYAAGSELTEWVWQLFAQKLCRTPGRSVRLHSSDRAC